MSLSKFECRCSNSCETSQLRWKYRICRRHQSQELDNQNGYDSTNDADELKKFPSVTVCAYYTNKESSPSQCLSLRSS